MHTNGWIAFSKPKTQAKLRLFCFPHAGGGASAYRLWSEELPPEIEVCPIQLPGRENRVMEPPLKSMSTLLDALVPVLLPYLNTPFAFFGHSLGALISFKLARHLRSAHDLQPVHLFVSGYQGPPLPCKIPPMSHLPDDEFLSQLRSLEYTPEAVFQHQELVDLLLPALKADFSVLENCDYSEEAPLDCPISAFGGERDILVFEEDLKAWESHTATSFKMRIYPGGHFFLQNSQKSILKAISDDLKKNSNSFPR